MAVRISGVRVAALKELSGPMPMEANRARRSFSEGNVGAYFMTKFKMLKNSGEVFC
jgi:hypothetical protein